LRLVPRGVFAFAAGFLDLVADLVLIMALLAKRAEGTLARASLLPMLTASVK
jgi:hypothetical protein